jgi:hypothetical protein
MATPGTVCLGGPGGPGGCMSGVPYPGACGGVGADWGQAACRLRKACKRRAASAFAGSSLVISSSACTA